MAKISSGGAYQKVSTTKRPGVHSKTKTSTNKNSQNYKKSYRGQGK